MRNDPNIKKCIGSPYDLNVITKSNSSLKKLKKQGYAVIWKRKCHNRVTTALLEPAKKPEEKTRGTFQQKSLCFLGGEVEKKIYWGR